MDPVINQGGVGGGGSDSTNVVAMPETPLFKKSMLFPTEAISPLESLVLSGHPLQAVKSFYEANPNQKITVRMVLDAHVYGVSNQDGVLDYLLENLFVHNNQLQCFNELLSYKLSQVWRQTYSAADLLPSFLKILSQPQVKEVHFGGWVALGQPADEFSDSFCFFNMAESIFRNKHIRRLHVSYEEFWDREDDSRYLGVIESVSRLLRNGECRINILQICVRNFDRCKYLDPFLTKVVMNLPELEELGIRNLTGNFTESNAVSLSKFLVMDGKLRSFTLGSEFFSSSFWSPLLEPLAQKSTLKNLCFVQYTGNGEWVDTCRDGLLRALEHHNTHLVSARFRRANCRDDYSKEFIGNALPFYLGLNNFGRGRARDPAMSLEKLVEDLVAVNDKLQSELADAAPEGETNALFASYTYLLLQECPNKWAG